MMDLTRQGPVFVLTFDAGENRFSGPFFDALERALGEVEAADGAAALVTTGKGKFYSNGIDLDWVGSAGSALPAFLRQLHRSLARVVALPVPTVAAMNGHTFAGGALLALAHDFRVMRSDRGFFCLPEVDIGIPFTAPLADLVRTRLAPQVAHRAMVTGRRFPAEEALALGIVDQVASEAEVLGAAVALATELAPKASGTLGAIKRNAYASVLAALEA